MTDGPYRIPGSEEDALSFLPAGKRYGLKKRTTVSWGQRIPMPTLTDHLVRPDGYMVRFDPEWCRQVVVRPLVIMAVALPEGTQLEILVNGETEADISGTAAAVNAVDGAMPGIFRMPKPVVLRDFDKLSFHLTFESGVLWNHLDFEENPKGVILAWYGLNTVDVPL